MKLAVFAAIHANLEALEAVLIDAENQGADSYVCLGDTIGYGLDATACIQRLIEVDAVNVLGNHDRAAIDPNQLRTFNYLARESILLSRERMTSHDLAYLSSLAYRRSTYGAVFSHANPIKPEEWSHLFLYEDIAWCMQRLDWPIGFFGHTHLPGIYCQTNGQMVPLTSGVVSVGHHKCLINPGSVGQPRDGDRRASFAMWDVDAGFVQIRRIEYPFEQTQKRMIEAGWPHYLADRLGRGD